MTFTLLTGDCVEVMAEMAEASVDAIVTDPPYGLGFMGKEWDTAARMASVPRSGTPDTPLGRFTTGKGPAAVAFPFRAFQDWCEGWATQALRVLKPGGHLLAFGGTRTYHRLACAIEDAGFEIRDCLAWMYGSGFPKSLDVSKAIDKAAGAEREVVGTQARKGRSGGILGTEVDILHDTSLPATPDAQRWQGWGTALKPAYEPIVLARKPLTGTVAANVQEHGTGALNVDECRIEGAPPSVPQPEFSRDMVAGFGASDGRNGEMSQAAGRWPANVLLDEQAAAMLDEQTGDVSYNKAGEFGTTKNVDVGHGIYGGGQGLMQEGLPVRGYGDRGGASRFFYTAKASSAERNRGVEWMEPQPRVGQIDQLGPGSPGHAYRPTTHNTHPTVKPVDLMQWLVRLITPPGGTVLDPFTGSGSTGMAALREGFDFIGIEREPDYVEIARARIVGDGPLFNVEAVT